MSQRHIIAILIAGLFVGVQVGLADVSESTYSDEQEYVEPAPIQAELEPAPAQAEPLDEVAVASLAEPSEIHAAPTVVSENVFPRSDGEYDMMPSVIAYLDRLEATRLAAARNTMSGSSEISLAAAGE